MGVFYMAGGGGEEVWGARYAWCDTLFPPANRQCYTVTVTDPLAPTAGLASRLLLAAGLIALLWLAVAWALL